AFAAAHSRNDLLAPAADDEAAAREQDALTASALADALAELAATSPTGRRAADAVRWHYLEGLGPAEVARRLGTSVPAARALVAEGLHPLRELWPEEVARAAR